LRELRFLEAFKNQLTTLPKEIVGLVSLEYMNVFNCEIRKRAPKATPCVWLCRTRQPNDHTGRTFAD
jgi:hypothetical protein